MRRTRALALAVLTGAALVTACGTGDDGTQEGQTVIRYQGSPSQVRWYELAADLGHFDRITLEWKGDTTSGPQDIQSVATNSVDVGGAFKRVGCKAAGGRFAGDRGVARRRVGRRDVPGLLLARRQRDRLGA